MQKQSTIGVAPIEISVRPLREAELTEAKRIFHLAFGTFLGLPDPMQFIPDRDFIRGRYFTNREGALGAEVAGALAGSNFVTHWGSVGFFGPLTIRPELWERGVAKRLLESTVQLFEKWRTPHAGLFTFPHSAKHVHLYQKFGFWPRFLTAVMSKSVQASKRMAAGAAYSELSAQEQAECLKAGRELTDSIYGGLNLELEIRAMTAQRLGDTIYVWDNSRLMALAVCYCGGDTEAGNGNCFVKFGAARNATAFEHLLDACEAFADRRGLLRLEAGVNLARHDAYRRMLARGFRTEIQGVAMHKSNDVGYSHPDAYVMDDWR